MMFWPWNRKLSETVDVPKRIDSIQRKMEAEELYRRARKVGRCMSMLVHLIRLH